MQESSRVLPCDSAGLHPNRVIMMHYHGHDKDKLAMELTLFIVVIASCGHNDNVWSLRVSVAIIMQLTFELKQVR